MRLYKIVALVCSFLLLATPAFCEDDKKVELDELSDGLKSIRIYLNYQNPNLTSHMMRHTNWEHKIDLPIPSRWEVVRANLHVEYTSSVVLKPSRSLLAIGLNDKVMSQRILNDPNVPEQIDLRFPSKHFEDYNSFQGEPALHNRRLRR